VSSSGVLGLSGSSVTIDESAPYALETSNEYFRSKIHAEQRLVDFLTAHRMPVVLLLRDRMLKPWNRPMQDHGDGSITTRITGVKALERTVPSGTT
jgi:nucleoside-diphosphate-sugar epimerase